MPPVRTSLERFLRDVDLIMLALAIALGWSLFQVASGISALVSTFLVDYDDRDLLLATRLSEPLTWEVGGRVLTFGPLLGGVIEFAVVLLFALVFRHRDRRAPGQPQASGPF